jgi:hypothetical protein
MKSTNPFCTKSRAVELYDSLKCDIEDKNDKILSSLPQFLRMGLIENQEAWAKAANHYDLLVEAGVSKKFGELSPVDHNCSVSLKILPEKLDIKFIPESDLRLSKIISLSGDDFTVQDFVLSISYHGTFHLEAKDRPELKTLYEEFIEKKPDLCMDLCFQIAEVLIKSFEEIRSKFDGNNDAYSDINSRMPMIIRAGSLVTFSSGETAAQYSNSYVQIPIRRQKSQGIRICLDLQLIEPVTSGHIFSYGHRKSKTRISLTYNHGALLASYISESGNHTFVAKVIPSLLQEVHVIELSIYPRGTFVIAINETLLDSHQLNSKFEIENGKIMIGSDLSGNYAGVFLHSSFSIEAINPYEQLTRVFRTGIREFKLQSVAKLSDDTVKRPCLV